MNRSHGSTSARNGLYHPVAPKILCKVKIVRQFQFSLRGKVSPCPVSIPYHGETGAVKGKSAAYLYGSGSPW